jgi:hypothetical protein
MEQTFAETLKRYDTEHPSSRPEQVAAREEMKKNFYDHLHQRMQQFFQPATPS